MKLKILEFLLKVFNKIFSKNLSLETFLINIFYVLLLVLIILFVVFIVMLYKYSKLRKNILKDNIQVVDLYIRNNKTKRVIKTKTSLRNPKKNKKVTKSETAVKQSKNVTDIKED